MLKDGVYELHYRAAEDAAGPAESLLLSLRDGNILGSDRWGSVFTGRCDFNPAQRTHRIRVRLHIPPGGLLITEQSPRSAACSIDVDATLGSAREIYAGGGGGLVDVGGQQVRVELEFKGPVPGAP